MAKKKKAAKSVAKKKAKAAVKKADAAPAQQEGLPTPPPVTGLAPPPAPTAQPYVAPGPQQFKLYAPVEDATLAQHRRPLSLDQVRLGIQRLVEQLKAAGLACPDALYTDIENVIIWLQTAEIGDVVKLYVQLIETCRYWHVYCEEQERDTERKRKLYQRQLENAVRDQAKAAGEKLTNDAVQSKVRADPEHDKWLGYQETWQFLGKQIQQIISSMQTEMLVQSSVWTQHELGMRDQKIPSGAVPATQ